MAWAVAHSLGLPCALDCGLAAGHGCMCCRSPRPVRPRQQAVCTGHRPGLRRPAPPRPRPLPPRSAAAAGQRRVWAAQPLGLLASLQLCPARRLWPRAAAAAKVQGHGACSSGSSSSRARRRQRAGAGAGAHRFQHAVCQHGRAAAGRGGANWPASAPRRGRAGHAAQRRSASSGRRVAGPCGGGVRRRRRRRAGQGCLRAGGASWLLLRVSGGAGPTREGQPGCLACRAGLSARSL